jgi:hypothetical protein
MKGLPEKSDFNESSNQFGRFWPWPLNLEPGLIQEGTLTITETPMT